ncbi:LytTR family transcriptional regulator DNA-binding domain-containing protein [Spirosoma radiotolerans]|uniref:LytTR family transcriptional regulator DNA-binding domain-containing protein n=1 Tax=Spirosoma radiotolerans TaxID=1379870 RepID=UPI00061D2915|nr:LytTR family transcriptional regulator DNA-binding domain-containing protein [Spirosoma radiotolerans]
MSVIKPALQYPELITHLSGANNYCWLHFRNGEKKLLAKPISYLECELPGFIRAHKTVLINPEYVKSLHQPPRQKMAGEIQLNNGLSFPVSRRRWNQVVDALAYRISPISSKGAVDYPGSTVPPKAPTPEVTIPEKSILLVSDDEASALLVGQMIDKKWPGYRFHTTNQANHLPDLLAGVSEEEYPALLILDARTTTLERLHTLQRLKQHPQLCRLPIILLVSPTDSLVTDGYRRQANSVISLQDGYITFSQTIERVCQFWLLTAALPGAAKTAAVDEVR